MADDVKQGERIAKVLARAGIASRRGAEILIVEGRVKVNGRVIDSPALNVGPRDRVLVDGKPLPDAEPTKLWLFHKPLGLVTTERDEQGRPTVFEALPPELGRVLSVGRLDLNSEGLLLLTNDGALKRRLELPSTGWLRRYRARVNGTPTHAMLEPLRKGIVVDGEHFQPMEVSNRPPTRRERVADAGHSRGTQSRDTPRAGPCRAEREPPDSHQLRAVPAGHAEARRGRAGHIQGVARATWRACTRWPDAAQRAAAKPGADAQYTKRIRIDTPPRLTPLRGLFAGLARALSFITVRQSHISSDSGRR